MAAPPSLSLRDIVARLGGEAVGEAAAPLTGVATLESAGPSQIAFLANLRYRSQLAATKAGAVILGPDEREATSLPRIVTPNPYAYYARTVALFNPAPAVVPGIHPTAQIDASARVAKSAEVGAFVVIGRGAKVGERAVIGAGCILGEDVTVGEDTRLHPRVTIYEGCSLGARGIVHSGVVIGADGFGMAPDAGRWVKIPQVGAVRIGDDVEVGANTTIDRGALDDTVIEEGVKLDNQIQVGHNCVIGAHTVIAGCVGIAGSVRIGKRCLIGGKAGITGHLQICDGVTVSAMTLITKSITKPGVYTSVAPFMPHADWLKYAARIRHGARGESDREHDDH
ncbi:UDP-3-O-(3-hydroxymyristoyl)glucosamine N-acyltransferase [Usitatibacter palustris]|uniref:UDP-3-O-acylglucosamine N-acyltransferase n=1 Tax=Usitatibacter palustris TaxID=2732487 RepID=A0A6M4H3Q1_9PROT|nr:UDP-3-O-(3-hydroxymyristoyl)glucosamine N-acyltransferase [Usitatibacter palustris]QJR14156.1 UDP-3-O-acylglucosamine N-acyltransferase [Usitatibacter palustris]